MSSSTRRHKLLTVRELVIFAMLGTMMFLSDLIMEGLPNIHLLGMFIATFTIVFRAKALFPIYVYVFLLGLSAGFNAWWAPYLYLWPILWGLIMLIPRKLPRPVFFVLVHAVTVLHGLAFGALYAPAQALMYGLDFKNMLRWIAAGISFDILHAVGNFVFGFFIYPLTKLLTRLNYGK